jgi:NAD(P)H-dependent FMN reductase
MATEDEAKKALDAMSEELGTHPSVTGLGIGTAGGSDGAALVVYLSRELKSACGLPHIPEYVEINRPDGSKVTVPVQVIEQDELKFE